MERSDHVYGGSSTDSEPGEDDIYSSKKAPQSPSTKDRNIKDGKSYNSGSKAEVPPAGTKDDQKPSEESMSKSRSNEPFQSMQSGSGISSSIPKIGASEEQFESLPRNCSYETKKKDWKKVYSAEGGKGEIVLLKDQRCETDFTYTRGSMDSTGDITVSETDIISHGLRVLLKNQDDSMKNIELPNLSKVLNLMQLSPEELTAVQEWLDQKYELSLKYERETHALLAFVKKILAEVKSLRKSITKYRQEISKLEKELSSHPSAEVLADMYKECDRLKKEIIALDQQQAAIIKSKVQLQRVLQAEFENSSKSENTLYLQIQNLKYENRTLQHLVEVFTSDAREASNSLLKRYEESLKKIRKLDNLLFRARALLEKKSMQTKEVQIHLQDQDRLVQGNVSYINLIQEHITNLRTDAENMQHKSASLTAHAVNLQNEILELLGNFNNLTRHLTDQNELEAEKKKNISQIKQILDSLNLQQKNVKKLEKSIIKLEKDIQLTEAKGRKEGVEIVNINEKENDSEKQSWDEKMIKIRNYFEEMEEVITTIKEEESEKKKTVMETSKKDTVGETFSHDGEETVKLSGRFICSDATAGELVTKSGVCNIAETILPQQSEARYSDSPEFARGVKSAYAVGLQRLTSVPESAKSQLHGIYTKYKLKDSEERSLPPSV